MLLPITIAVLAGSFGADPMMETELIFPIEEFHNHGSSIVEAANGDLLACWFHGHGERNSDDVAIRGARKRAGDATWSETFAMADTPNLPDCNSVLFIDPRGTLWLIWIAVQDNEWGGSLLKYRTTDDYSKDGPPNWKWQDVIHARPLNFDTKYPELLVKAETKYGEYFKSNERIQKQVEAIKQKLTDKLSVRLGWMTRLHPIMLSDGNMMLGLYSDVWNCSLAAFTKDGGQTWEFSEPIGNEDFGNIQPSFVVKKDGGIMALMRDNGAPKKIRAALSTDNGRTWPKVWNLDIPNPGSSLECISLKNGNWVLVCNDQPRGRHIVTAYLSDDEGATWKWHRRLEDFSPEEDSSGAYPSVIQTKDGSIHATYSYKNASMAKGSTIKHLRFNEEWIKAGQN
jgi:predicted neuraminidase